MKSGVSEEVKLHPNEGILKEEKQERRSPGEGRRREGRKSVGEGDVNILLDAEIANNDRPGGKS